MSHDLVSWHRLAAGPRRWGWSLSAAVLLSLGLLVVGSGQDAAGPPTPAPSAGSQPAAARGELVENGGFEQTDAKGFPVAWRIDWRGFTGVKVDLAKKSRARSGNRALHVLSVTSPIDVWIMNRPLDVSSLAGQDLIVSCFYRMMGDAAVSLALITYHEPFAAKEWNTPHLTSERTRLVAAPNWRLLHWRVHVPETAQQAVLLIRPSAEGEMLLDDVSVRPVEGPIRLEPQVAGDIVNWRGERELRVRVDNDTATEHVLRLGFVAGEGDHLVRRDVAVKVAAHGQTPVTIAYVYSPNDAHRLELALDDPATQAIYDTWIGRGPAFLSGRVTTPAFRGTILNSIPDDQIVVRGRVNAADALCREISLRADLGGAGVVAREGAGLTHPDGPASWCVTIPAQGLLRGEYPLTVIASRGEQKVATLEVSVGRAPDAPHEVGYDDRGRLIVDGKAVFVNGLYNARNEEDLVLAADQGFNLVVAPSSAVSRDFAQLADKHGMMVILYSEQAPPTEPSATPTFWEHMVEKHRANGAVIGWHLMSRPDAILVPVEAFAAQQAAMPNVDVHHPTITLLSVPSLLSDFAPYCDIMAFESLPVPALPVETLAGDLEHARRAAVPGHPVWAGIQSVGRAWLTIGGGLEEQEGGRPPTGPEHRALTFLALVHGAQGLLHHGLYFPSGQGRSAYYLPTTAPDLWQAMKHTNALVAKLSSAIAGGEYRGCEVTGPVHVGAWDWGGQVYVAAVSVRPEPSLVTFRVPGKTPDTLRPTDGSAPLASAKDGRFADEIPAYGVRVYVGQ